MSSTTVSEDAWLIETERLRLRAVTVDDSQLMLSVWNDPEFIRHVADRGIKSEEAARDAIRDGAAKLFEDYGYGPYCMQIRESGEMIGICGLFKRENLEYPDLGFAVLPDFRARGYLFEAARAVIEYARDSLGVTTLTAITSPNNTPSRNAIEKLGMTLKGDITMPGEDEAICLYGMSLRG